MRLRGLGVDTHDGPRVGDKSEVPEAAPNEFGHVVFRHLCDEVQADVAVGLLHDLGQLRCRRAMGGKLLRCPAQQRVLAQVRRGDNPHSQAPHELHRTCVHQGNPGQRRVGGVFHGDGPLPSKETAERGNHPPLGGEDGPVKPSRGEPASINVVYQQPRLSPRRHQEPARPGQMVHRPRHLQEERIRATIVVDEPGVGAVVSQVDLGLSDGGTLR